MKKFFWIVLCVLMFALVLSGCNKECEHEAVTDEAVAPTCTADGLTEGSHCAICQEVLAEQKVVEAKGHELVTDEAVAPTCIADGLTEGKHCSVCNEILVQQEIVEKLGHTVVTDPAIPSTCCENGKTEGSHCSVCKKVLVKQLETEKLEHTEAAVQGFASTCLKYGASEYKQCEVCKKILEAPTYIEPTGHNYVDGECTNCHHVKKDFTDISLYRSNEGYRYFEIAQNGDAMRRMYDEMEQVLTHFHTSTTWDAGFYSENEELGDLYFVQAFDYAKHGLTLEEAQTVYTVFRKDHPVFYWMTYWLYWNGTYITVTTVDDFALAEDRMECNRRLYDTIEEYVMLAAGETSAYEITLIYYEAILNNNSYAYTQDGGVESEMWAHGIIGDVLYDKFVCEGYAKLMQLLLNVSGIENMYVSGGTPGAHFWNLVRMDDGKWYWVDPTWGDGENIDYYYFCTIDKDMTTHILVPSNQYGMYFNGTLPERSETYYDNENSIDVWEIFVCGGEEYLRCSSDTVILLDSDEITDEKIVYNGVVYKVIK